MNVRSKIKAAIIAGSLILANSAYAGEVRVVDADGMTRAIIRAKNTVRIELGMKSLVETESIQNVEGVNPDIALTKTGDRLFIYSPVPDGVWRLTGDSSTVESVRLIEDQPEP